MVMTIGQLSETTEAAITFPPIGRGMLMRRDQNTVRDNQLSYLSLKTACRPTQGGPLALGTAPRSSLCFGACLRPPRSKGLCQAGGGLMNSRSMTWMSMRMRCAGDCKRHGLSRASSVYPGTGGKAIHR